MLRFWQQVFHSELPLCIVDRLLFSKCTAVSSSVTTGLRGRSAVQLVAAHGLATSDKADIPGPKKGSAADVPDRPPPPEAKPVIEPGSNTGEWKPDDPKFKKMTQQLVWGVQNTPSTQEAEKGGGVHAVRRDLPVERHTKIDDDLHEDDSVGPGALNASQLKQLLIKVRDTSSIDVAQLASEAGVDKELLQKVLKYVEAPVILEDEPRGLSLGLRMEEAQTRTKIPT